MRKVILILVVIDHLVCALCATDPISEFEEFRNENREHILEVKSEEIPKHQNRLSGLVFNRVEMLRRLPDSVAGRSDIKLLMFRGGSVVLSDQLMADIVALPGLHYLTFDGARIMGDFSAFSRLRDSTNLRYFRLSALGELQAPLEVFTLHQLEVLDLSRVILRRVPQTVENMKRLTALSISGCGIRKIDAKLGLLQSLEVLVLNDNELHDLNLTGCHKLRIIDLSSNKLTEIPTGVEDALELKELWLFDNYLSSLATDSLPKGLQRLSVSEYTKIDSERLMQKGISVRVME